MKKILATLAAIALLLAPAAPAGVNVMAVATATTTTADTGVITSERRFVQARVYNEAGTATVVLEEQSADGIGPWTVVATMVNCTASTASPPGVDASGVPCSYSTITPRVRTRLRVSACSGCSVHRIIQDVTK